MESWMDICHDALPSLVDTKGRKEQVNEANRLRAKFKEDMACKKEGSVKRIPQHDGGGDVQCDEVDEDDHDDTVTSKRPRSQTWGGMYKFTQTCTKAQARTIRLALAKWVYEAGLPLSVFHGEAAVAAFRLMAPAFMTAPGGGLPDRWQLSDVRSPKTLLNTVSGKIEAQVNAVLEEASCLTAGVDGYETVTGSSVLNTAITTETGATYMRGTIHGCGRRQTSEAHFEAIEKDLARHNMLAVATDNPSVMLKMRAHIASVFPHVEPISCYFHLCDLVAKAALEIPIMAAIVALAQYVVKFFKMRKVLKGHLEILRNDKNAKNRRADPSAHHIPTLKLKGDTRQCSALNAVASVLANLYLIRRVLSGEEEDVKVYLQGCDKDNLAKVQRVKDIVGIDEDGEDKLIFAKIVLVPIALAQREMERTALNLSDVHHHWTELIDFYTNTMNSDMCPPADMILLLDRIKELYEQHFTPLTALACHFDPRRFVHTDANQRLAKPPHLGTTMERILEAQLDKRIAHMPLDAQVRVRQELLMFRKGCFSDRALAEADYMSGCDWWTSNGRCLPYLSQLAQKVMGVVHTASPLERINSACKHVHNFHRNGLSNLRAELLTKIYVNSRALTFSKRHAANTRFALGVVDFSTVADIPLEALQRHVNVTHQLSDDDEDRHDSGDEDYMVDPNDEYDASPELQGLRAPLHTTGLAAWLTDTDLRVTQINFSNWALALEVSSDMDFYPIREDYLISIIDRCMDNRGALHARTAPCAWVVHVGVHYVMFCVHPTRLEMYYVDSQANTPSGILAARLGALEDKTGWVLNADCGKDMLGDALQTDAYNCGVWALWALKDFCDFVVADPGPHVNFVDFMATQRPQLRNLLEHELSLNRERWHIQALANGELYDTPHAAHAPPSQTSPSPSAPSPSPPSASPSPSPPSAAPPSAAPPSAATSAATAAMASKAAASKATKRSHARPRSLSKRPAPPSALHAQPAVHAVPRAPSKLEVRGPLDDAMHINEMRLQLKAHDSKRKAAKDAGKARKAHDKDKAMVAKEQHAKLVAKPQLFDDAKLHEEPPPIVHPIPDIKPHVDTKGKRKTKPTPVTKVVAAGQRSATRTDELRIIPRSPQDKFDCICNLDVLPCSCEGTLSGTSRHANVRCLAATTNNLG